MTRILVANPEWMARGLCREVDPDIFFPSQGESSARAKRICVRCEVREQCAEWGKDENFGVWGGRQRDRGRSRHYEDRTCIGLCGGTVFIPVAWTQIYCTQECGDLTRLERTRDAKEAQRQCRGAAS